MRRLLAAVAATVLFGVLFAVPANAEVQTWIQWQNKRNPGMCMGVSGGDMTNGTPIIQWPCNAANPDQLWRYIPLDGDTNGYLLQSKKDIGKCLSVPGNWTSPNVGLIIWNCQAAGGTGQTWDAVSVNSGGYYRIRNFYTDRIIAGNGTAQGTAVIQTTFASNDLQIWRPLVFQEV